MTLLQEERNSLLAENDVLTDRANQLDAFDDLSTPSGRKHSQLQQQLELLQEENFRFVLVWGAPSWPPSGFESLGDFVTLRSLGWRLPRMTTGSTVRIWRSSWSRSSTGTTSWPAWLRNPELSKTSWTFWGLWFELFSPVIKQYWQHYNID